MPIEKSITYSSRGRMEVRSFVESGEYAMVEYRDPKTLRVVENKFKIYLKSEDGRMRGFLFIPLKGEGRYLVIEDKEVKKDLYAYIPDEDREIILFK